MGSGEGEGKDSKRNLQLTVVRVWQAHSLAMGDVCASSSSWVCPPVSLVSFSSVAANCSGSATRSLRVSFSTKKSARQKRRDIYQNTWRALDRKPQQRKHLRHFKKSITIHSHCVSTNVCQAWMRACRLVCGDAALSSLRIRPSPEACGMLRKQRRKLVACIEQKI